MSLARRPGQRHLASAALLALLCTVAWGSLQPGLAPPGHFHLDKLAHVGAFVAVSILAALACRGTRHLAAAQLALAGFAAAIEIAQSATPGRQGSLLDWAADLAGLALGVVLVQVVRRIVGAAAGIRF
ncbi:VanZ family protein [Arenibaculum sp.]|jgi:VanZ family protein|uniref:VanZ family protein n=1 Tax=Arenibaculum sp. TaxID=2865862 RepID=UPI002E0E7F56|nr:VanZ family protein [Arenibaculum sp.]